VINESLLQSFRPSTSLTDDLQKRFLSNFNFTIFEDSPFDREMAIDPEIMGKVSEQLVDWGDSAGAGARARAGIFYTDRTEIDLMSRLALVDYLANHIGKDKRLLYQAVFALSWQEQVCADQALTDAGLWRDIAELLRIIRVFDPACGSGSFLVAQLRILDQLQARAATQLGIKENVSERKRRIISNNLYGIDTMEWACQIARQRLWLALIADKPDTNSNLPYDKLMLQELFNIECLDSLLEGFEKVKGDFDLIIGNPPYVRQESIHDPGIPYQEAAQESKRAYKAKLAHSIYHAFPEFFGRSRQGRPLRRLDAKSDLYIYFFFRCLALLKSNGTLCFITSNSWLNVGYGRFLQEFLLKHCHMKMVLDNQTKRSFTKADINTVIVLLSSRDQSWLPGLDNIVRLISLKIPFQQANTGDLFINIESVNDSVNNDEFAVAAVNQKDLLADIANKTTVPLLKTVSYLGKHLRVPEIYQTILQRGKGKLKRLGDIAIVRRGITTGANDFFYLERDSLSQWGMEERFLSPILKSPRQYAQLQIDVANLQHKIFICDLDKDELSGTAAQAYIEWGEAQGYHYRPSCCARTHWWRLGRRVLARLHFNYLIDSTARTFYTDYNCYASDNFQEIHISDTLVLPLCAALNATICQLIINVAGRANFGGGLLKLQTYEVAQLLCLDPTLIPAISEQLFAGAEWDVLTPSKERIMLDSIIYDILGLTVGEREGVYEAVQELVQMRIAKASNLKNE
ncbi:MAG: DNA methyltransferase, partial [Acidobacteriota bacterium]